MTMHIYLVGGLNGGAGRSLTAALLAFGLHLHGRRTLLVQQTGEGIVSEIEPLAVTLPLPCGQLALPEPYSLPDELTGMRMMINNTDDRFMDALDRLAIAEMGHDADVVVDLCCNERALNAAAICEAAMVVLPVRASVFELNCAVRSFAHARRTQCYRKFAVPILLATIAPDEQRSRQQELLGSLLRNCDPDLLPGDPSEIMIEVPFLDEATLKGLFDERPIWQNPDLIARCRAFAAAAGDCAAILMGDDDDL